MAFFPPYNPSETCFVATATKPVFYPTREKKVLDLIIINAKKKGIIIVTQKGGCEMIKKVLDSLMIKRKLKKVVFVFAQKKMKVLDML